MELSVLERQQERLNWLHQQSYPNSTQFLHEMGVGGGDGSTKVKQQLGCFGNVITSVSSNDTSAMKVERTEDLGLVKKVDSAFCRENSKKRKAESLGMEDCKDKCKKGDSEEAESKITKKSSRETSTDKSKENSKTTEAQKPDYIHVRARRGQATDSHSLAERARREKISKKMKCLQDLVPGCNKVMGKAGMLDEIINYVQSLQRQVEFLSMKLSALNPQLDFNIDDFVANQFPACVASFPAATTCTPPAGFAFNQLNPSHQVSTSCNLDDTPPIGPSQAAAQRILSSSVPCPELYLDSSCLSHVQSFQNLDTNLQKLYGLGFQ